MPKNVDVFKYSKRVMILTLILVSVTTLNAFAISDSVRKLVEFETQYNGAAQRSNQMIRLPHVEIPLDLIRTDFAQRIDSKTAESLIFEREGRKYVRWILNPEDTRWGDELIRHFREKRGIKLSRQYYFEGYQTSSRSYIAENPENGAQFSVKSSTNVAGGKWKDKKQPVGEAIDSRLVSNLLYQQNKRRKFENFTFMDEPAILSAADIDQAVVIRDLSQVKRTDRTIYYLPGFSALHEKLGAAIARINGSENPYEYWTENYIKTAGRALGELAARTGMQFDSPHSQNFLIELDEKMRPTGRLVLRDMADICVDRNFILALEGKGSHFLSNFTQNKNMALRGNEWVTFYGFHKSRAVLG